MKCNETKRNETTTTTLTEVGKKVAFAVEYVHFAVSEWKQTTEKDRNNNKEKIPN